MATRLVTKLLSKQTVLASDGIKNLVIPEMDLSGLLQVIIAALLIVGILGGFLYAFMGALKWITSGGDKNKLAEGQRTVTQAIIGIIMLFSLFVILKLIGTLFGINILDLPVPRITDLGGS